MIYCTKRYEVRHEYHAHVKRMGGRCEDLQWIDDDSHVSLDMKRDTRSKGTTNNTVPSWSIKLFVKLFSDVGCNATEDVSFNDCHSKASFNHFCGPFL
jgi:hypothetical protein